ncbi:MULTISPECIES: hypothetical protein [Bacillus]|uniref:Uncharacterized protein n=1 Tax=Bacillus cereus TaxID=1396 RepID=A0A9X6ZDY3_BACCE|nr:MULTISPECIES: hypothetical protein [Bacillus cereus group]PEZ75396.1 hypothetical protein CN410_15145 [Bacillus anthracis]KXY51247.1 hypothetical protein AT268_32670 [Bacillus cereus]MED0951459.1 hypothetical protein [Bacillus mobilis]PES55183.1 hypothetical protein CN515_03760 [Bacillus cereus]PFA29584.1 hypothetical protein CN384_07785 [Bacillus thuringiensis]
MNKYMFQEGQTVTLFVKGAGVVSREKREIESIQDEIINLVDSNKEFSLDGKCLTKDEFFGFEFWIKPFEGDC